MMWQEIRQGGLNAPCVEAMVRALQVTWVKRMCTSHDSAWRRLLQAKIGEFELNNIFKIRRSQLALKGWNIPLFYRTVIDEFQKLNEIKISSGGDVRRVILWNNDDICIDNAAVFHRSLYRGGVSCIDHIAKQSGFSKWLWVLDCRGAAVRGAKAPIVSKKMFDNGFRLHSRHFRVVIVAVSDFQELNDHYWGANNYEGKLGQRQNF